MQTELAAVLLSSLIVNNIVLVQMLGVSPFFAYRSREDAAIAVALVTSLVLILAQAINFVLYHALLQPFALLELRLLLALTIIGGLVLVIDRLIKIKMPDASRAAGIYIPLIITNAAILSLSLSPLIENGNILLTLAASVGSALGYCVVLALFCCLQERLATTATPKAFQGAPIYLITLGLMALALMGFSGSVAG